MNGYDPDANITLNTGSSEEEWYRIGLAAQERLHALKRSAIMIPEALRNAVRIRHANENPGMVVRVLRGASPRAQALLH